MLLRMFSTEVAVREVQPSHALAKQLLAGVPAQESKKLAGKLVRLVQVCQVLSKLVPLDVSINGKLVRLVHRRQALLKPVPLDVSISGKLVRLLQLYQAAPKSLTPDVSISGKLVRLAHSCQARPKLAPPVASTVASKDSRLLQPQKLLSPCSTMLSGAGPSATTFVS